jgi:aminoglycoside phosphotransferase (APT) family kinase protein
MNFDYSPELDSTVTNAVETALQTSVLKVTKLEGGMVNYVYKVDLSDRSVIARIFRQPSEMAREKLGWIEAELTKRNISHAKTLHVEAAHPIFVNGWMLQEFIEGQRADDFIKDTSNEPEYYQKLGAHLKEVHAIPVERFGDVNNGHGEHEDYFAANQKYMQGLFEKFNQLIDFPEGTQEKTFAVLESLRSLESKLKPVLVHTDANESNVIVKDNGELALIDWDNARGLFWVQDLAYLTAIERYREAWGESRDDKSPMIRENFLNGHGLREFTEEEILQIERWSHVIQGLNWLNFFIQNIDEGDNRKEAEGVCKIFLELLEESEKV